MSDDLLPQTRPTGEPERPEDSHLPATLDEPIANPGLPAHTWRPTDVDPKAEKRAERQVSAMFLLSGLFTLLFVVAYFLLESSPDNVDTFGGLGAQNVAMGLSLGLALLLIGVGIIQYARKLMADQEISEERHPAASPPEDREATLKALNDGLDESGIGRRPMVRNSLLGAVSLLAIPAVVSLRDLGPTPGQVSDAAAGTGLDHTLWGATEGGYAPPRRVVRDVLGTPILASELQIGDLVNGVPDGIFDLEGIELQVAKSKAPVIVVRMEPEEIQAVEGREDWSVEGIICYSKICTHVGCPISLYERTTHHVLCPCHQSTFDLADGAKVIFGPAARPLPQLNLGVDDEGYLVAMSDFNEPVGPSYWERER